jgi:hypothetical protein
MGTSFRFGGINSKNISETALTPKFVIITTITAMVFWVLASSLLHQFYLFRTKAEASVYGLGDTVPPACAS